MGEKHERATITTRDDKPRQSPPLYRLITRGRYRAYRAFMNYESRITVAGAAPDLFCWFEQLLTGLPV